MQIEQRDMDSAVKAELITADQAQKLWSFWQKSHEHTPQFRFTHVMYYFGGMLTIIAITLFITQTWEKIVGLPLFVLSSLLFLLGLLLAHYFLKKNLRIPAGIMATFSLVFVPLAIYNIQTWLGYSPHQKFSYSDFHYWVNWYWVPMELATLAVGAILLYCYRFPFLLFPISITLWYMSMDLWPLLFGMDNFSFTQRAIFSMYFGLVVILAAIYMDFKHSNDDQDYAFWLYIIGVIIFWGGLSCQESESELTKFFYCLINIFMILVSVFLNRKIFAVFGALGVLGYLGHLSLTVFSKSIGFPIALVFLGLIIIFMATKWSSVERRLFEYFRPYMPQKIIKRMQR
ncbi:MAG: DUF2157 domain-containing protein [Gammaproteobacteria bacterium]|nr:DUF2157 domain-containing protein [Gammaproteobacteria bacterium]MCW5583485.1 DUF2157 domain-containing protein [Gammaproteobacteria bacterium]